MKVEAKALAAVLSRVLPLCKSRSTLPILTCVKISAKIGEPDKLTVHATDLDAHAAVSCDCDGELPPMCVDAQSLRFLAHTAEGTMSIYPENKRLLVEGAGAARLGVFPPEEYPNWPDENPKALGVNAGDLANCIERVSWACADPGKPGTPLWHEVVRVHTEEKFIECCGTDQNEFAFVKLPAIAAKATFLVPVKQVPLLVQAMRAPDAQVYLCPNFVFVTSDYLKVAVRLAEEGYPNLGILLDRPRKNLNLPEIPALVQTFETIKALSHGEVWCKTELTFIPDSLHVKAVTKEGWFTRDFKVKNDWTGDLRVDAFKATRVFQHAGPEAKASLAEGHALFLQDGDYLYSLALLKGKE